MIDPGGSLQVSIGLDRDAGAPGADPLVLLIETAEGFFAGLGGSVADGQAVPDGIKGSTEVRSLCTDSAIGMTKFQSTHQ